MINPFGFATGLSSLIDDTVDWFDGDGADRPSPPPPPVDYRSLFDEEPAIETVAGSGPGGVQKAVRQPSLVDDASDPRFPALQQAWREGKPVEDLLGKEPFRLKSRIAGNGGDNWRPDVAKVQVLLNKAGYHSTTLDRDIRSFQRANKLAVDGKLSPEGETIRTLERTLSPKPKVAAQEDMPKDKQSQDATGAVGAGLDAAPSVARPDKLPPVKLAPGRKEIKAPDWESEAMFEELVEPVFKDEGGYSNNKFDRGGETNFGITAGTLEKYQKIHGNMGSENIKIGPNEITKQQAKEIYRNEFFYGQRLNEIKNPAIATAILDATVIHGPKRAWQLLQRSINSIDNTNALVVDGIGGTSTIKKIDSLSFDDVRRLILENDKVRRESISQLIAANPSQTQFDRGWNNRLDKVKRRALAYVDRDASS